MTTWKQSKGGHCGISEWQRAPWIRITTLTELQLPRIWPYYPASFSLLAHAMGAFLSTPAALLVLHLGNLPGGQRSERPAECLPSRRIDPEGSVPPTEGPRPLSLGLGLPQVLSHPRTFQAFMLLI